MENTKKAFLDFISEGLEVEIAVKSVGNYGKLASYSGYDFSGLKNDTKIIEIMTLCYIDILVNKNIITPKIGTYLKELYIELKGLNNIYGKILSKNLFDDEANKKQEDTSEIEKSIQKIENILQSYGILNEDGYLDFKLNIPKAMEASIEEKYKKTDDIYSNDALLEENYQEIMKKVRTIK